MHTYTHKTTTAAATTATRAVAATATTHRLVNQEPRVAFWIHRLHLRRSGLADDPFGDRNGLADLEPGRSDLQGWMNGGGWFAHIFIR